MPFPDRLADINSLVEAHRSLEREPLLLAIYYAVDPQSESVSLFEILDGFGYNEVSRYRELFEVDYNSTPGFPLQANAQLQLILTNPIEFQQAVDEDWNKIPDLRRAILDERYTVIYSLGDAERQFMDRLRNGAVAI